MRRDRKKIENTLKYTHVASFKSDEHICKITKTLPEATNPVQADLYLTDMDDSKIFRKRK